MSLDLPPTLSARSDFGARLRHWRLLRGLSQAELGRRLGYDDSHISRVENTRRWPPAGMAERLDELLGTAGELAGLWPQVERERRRLARYGRPGTAAPGPDALEQLLTAYRTAAHAVGGQALVDVLEQHARLAARQQRTAPSAERARFGSLAARYAELAGWARFDRLEYGRALAWYDCGREWAAVAGDPAGVSLLLARQSAVHWACGHSAAAIGAAGASYEQALRAGRPAAQARALLARARGHALAADRRETERALEEAARLTEAEPTAEARTRLLLVHGTCHRDLAVRTGRRAHARVATAGLDEALIRLPLEQQHYRALVTARLAGAHVWAGRPEAAGTVLARVPAAEGRVALERRQSERWLSRHIG
ncbi:transcriptional regulator with XRE-family HTH domain [Kitasatospora gansuensis]|uniref:Transcriptional regulator with XRE-family HTH domain n=1 Tax=Kitasatospora gansuensis TaxID=258050 RepID=A0A7W7WL31_9ACTN|nr:helix-turn-helix transcriptional regulator [Kitasatospora gansuensis]MBB4950848.1 transcriptional regulator with XRE-family HTH domain [Kitasatospora gansuensis]